MVVTYKTKEKINTIIGKKTIYKRFSDDVWNLSLEDAEKRFKSEILIKIEGNWYNLKDIKCMLGNKLYIM